MKQYRWDSISKALRGNKKKHTIIDVLSKGVGPLGIEPSTHRL